MDKSVNVIGMHHIKEKVPDIQIAGSPGDWKLLCKAWSVEQKWFRSTKAYQVPGGCLVQVSTQVGDNIAEAITFVPGVCLYQDTDNRAIWHMVSFSGI